MGSTENGIHIFSIFVGFVNLASIAVILTPILFKRLRRLFFLRIIAMISLCDSISAVSFLLNLSRPANAMQNNSLCEVQGILYTFSTNASISWTVALGVQLYAINKHSRPFFNEVVMHLLFWGIPIFIEFVPLIAGITYGMDDYYPTEAIYNCFVRTENITTAKLSAYLFAVIIYKLIALLLLVIFYCLTKAEIERQEKSTELAEVVKIMKLYPIALAISWVPRLISELVFQLGIYNEYVGYTFQITSSFYGVIVAFIYFKGSKQAREHWYSLFSEGFSALVAPLLFTTKSMSSSRSTFYVIENDIVITESTDNDILLNFSNRNTDDPYNNNNNLFESLT